MRTLMGIVLLSLVLVAPLQAAETERVGVVHAMQILSQMPEFQKYSREYSADQAKLKSLKGKQRSAMLATMDKWQKIKSQFVTTTMQKMQTAADKVQKDKSLAYVLLDAPWSGATLGQDGAVDVTTDVIFAMRGQ